MNKKKQNIFHDLMVLADSLEKMKQNKKRLEESNQHIQAQLTLLAQQLQEKKISQDEFNQKSKIISDAIKEYGPLLDLANVKKSIEVQEKYVKGYLGTIAAPYLNKDTRKDLEDAFTAESTNKDEISAILDKTLNNEKYEPLDIERESIAPEEASREMIKSFQTMSYAIETAIAKLEEAIGALDQFLNADNQEIIESQTEVKGDGQSVDEAETVEAKKSPDKEPVEKTEEKVKAKEDVVAPTCIDEITEETPDEVVEEVAKQDAKQAAMSLFSEEEGEDVNATPGMAR